MLARRREGAKGNIVIGGAMPDRETLASVVVDCALGIHRELGPGLLESVYLDVLARELERRGLRVERRKRVAFEFRGVRYDRGLTVDLIVEGELVLELKSVERLAAVHFKQLLTYLRLMDKPLGLLINFGGPRLKGEIRRVVNGYKQ